MQNSYGTEDRKDSLYYTWEKIFALHIYLFRKPVLAFCLVLLGTIRIVANILGFNFSGSVSDREAWIWEPYKNLPLYRAYVKWERVN